MPTLKSFVWIVTGAAVLTVLYVGVAPMFAPWQQQSKLQRTVRDTAVPVTVDKAQIADVPVYLNGVGNVKALNTVVVRPQADGKLIEFTFKEGDEVKAGDVLARLDASTMQAQLDQVLAKKELDQSMQANSQRDLDRLVKAGTLAAT